MRVIIDLTSVFLQMDTRSRAFCFTLNNPDAGTFDALKELKGTTYGIIANEVGESGTPHIQGYLYFKSAAKLKAVINKLAKIQSSHVEIARGTPKEASDYCKKDGDYFEWGALPEQGRRRDLEDVKTMIDEGATMKAVADAHFGDYVRYHSGFTKYKAMADAEKTKDFRKVEVVFITGPTGCGKTKKAMEEAQFKIEGSNLKWWDGYNGEECILIDEYANQINCADLLTLLDGYQKRLEIKGGFTYARWTKVYITSNLRRLHESAIQEHQNALERRITETIDMWPEPVKRVKLTEDFIF